ncbi:hypothetical protein GJ496_005515 [Pomphorhynchus laevis]|nr:hypothetical protein GJ496_005515 [Pomphorhynchus laevis]
MNLHAIARQLHPAILNNYSVHLFRRPLSIDTSSSKKDEIITKSKNTAGKFCSAVCKDDAVIRTFRQLRNDFDTLSPTGRGFFLISTGVTGYFLMSVIGPIPLTTITGGYITYKYLKHTGKIEEWRQQYDNMRK